MPLFLGPVTEKTHPQTPFIVGIFCFTSSPNVADDVEQNWFESVDMARLGKLVNRLSGEIPSDQRVKDLVEMTNKAREMGGE